jgi:alpha-galactosidase
VPNEKFGDMKTMCDEIHQKGAKAGLWFRPLLARGDFPKEQVLTEGFSGQILDPSHPAVLKIIEEDTLRIRSWGFELIKHDFTQIDMFGTFEDACEISEDMNLYSRKRSFFDKTITNAMITKNLYKAIARGAGDADVIACNGFGHLAAGIHSVYRVGMDTSGRVFEITRSNGINSMMRLPLNQEFYLVDPDCAAFTNLVDRDLNLDFLEMCAITGVTTLASVVPNILTDEEMKRINKVFRMADSATTEYGIKNYEKTCCPEVFVDKDGTEKAFDWYKKHDGVRVKFDWGEN